MMTNDPIHKPYMMMRLLMPLSFCLLLAALPAAAQKSQGDAAALVERSLSQIGDLQTIQSYGGISLEGKGSLDLSAALQGRKPAVSEKQTWQERYLFDPEKGRFSIFQWGRVAYDTPMSRERLFTGDGRVRDLNIFTRSGVWRTAQAEESQSYQRLIPQILLEEVRARPNKLSLAKRYNGIAVVKGQLSSGEPIFLGFDETYGALFWAEMDVNMPIIGPLRWRWQWGDWVEVAKGLKLPRNISIRRGERSLKTVRFETPSAGVSTVEFELPLGFTVRQATASQKAKPQLIPVADGVWQAANVQPGFYPLIVDFGDFLSVVEAPSASYTPHALPPAPGNGLWEPSEALIDLAHEAAPGKEIRFLILTQWHADTSGGLGAFLQDDVTVITGTDSKIIVDTAAEALRESRKGSAAVLETDKARIRAQASNKDWEPSVLSVNGSVKLVGSKHDMSVIGYPYEDHAVGMLVVTLPQAKLIFQTDLFTTDAHSGDKVRTNFRFAKWLEKQGIADWTLLSSRTLGPIKTDEVLAVRPRQN